MKHTLRKIDESGLFVEDVPHWDDGAQDAIPEVIGVPQMQDGVQATDDVGNLLWEVAPQAAIPAVPPLPFPANHIPGVISEGFIRPKWDGAQWIEGSTPPPLSVIKEAKLAQFRQDRTDASAADVTVSGSVFTSEPDTQTGFKRLGDRMRRGKNTTLQAILDKAGSPVALSASLLDAIEDAIAVNTEAAWNKYGQLAGQVNAATTAAEVEAVNW